MPTVFRKTKYQTEIISKETYKKWKEENPIYKNIPFSKFIKYWKELRTELIECILENPNGVDLPLFLGNLSIRVLDKEFKCTKDFNYSILTNKITGLKEKLPFISSTIPKKIKITWTKHPLFQGFAKILAIENQDLFKKTISAGVRGRENYYQKAFDKDKIKSKCEDIPVKTSFFDKA